MVSADTIAAIATPYGRSAIGVIRFSGSNVCKIITKFIRREIKTRYAYNTIIFDEDGNPIDDAVVIFYKSPTSYTGEDMLEIQSHGNPAILNYIMEHTCKELARLSKPGEFTERAFLNNKIDLTQAEAIADIINASNISASKAALISLSGAFSNNIEVLIQKVLKIRAEIEANINFPEDDSPDVTSTNNIKNLNSILDGLRKILSSVKNGIAINQKPVVSIAGKPNVGKSSLANLLLGEKGSIVSETPGTTRDSLKHEIVVNDTNITIIDTAGLRNAIDPLEAEGIKISKQSFSVSSLVLYMVDDRIGFDNEDQKLIDENNIKSYWIVHNKTDLTKSVNTNSTKSDTKVFYISLLKKLGIEPLKKELSHTNIPLDETTGTARERHLDELNLASKHIHMAIKYSEKHQLDLVAEELRFAHGRLVAIVGGDINEDLLDKVFSDFCIGK